MICSLFFNIRIYRKFYVFYQFETTHRMETLFVYTQGDTYLLTYLGLIPLVEEHRLFTNVLNQTLSRAILFSSFQFLFIHFMCALNSRHSVFFGLSFFHFHSRFQVSACFMVQMRISSIYVLSTVLFS